MTKAKRPTGRRLRGEGGRRLTALTAAFKQPEQFSHSHRLLAKISHWLGNIYPVAVAPPHFLQIDIASSLQVGDDLADRTLGNAHSPGNLEAGAVRVTALEQKPLLAGYLDPITIREGLVTEELWAAQLYSGDALSAAEKNPDIAYVVPREGAALWVDNLVIPVGAPNREEAEQFLNYVLRPRVAASLANYLFYASPNREAHAFISSKVLEKPYVYPPLPVFARLEFYQSLDDDILPRLNGIWAKLVRP